MKIFTARCAALALGLAAGLAALPALAADKDPVIAVVNGTEIHASTLAAVQGQIPPGQQPPYAALLDKLIGNELAAQVARKEGVQNDPEVKRAVKLAEDQFVVRAWVGRKMKDVSEAAVKAQYDQVVAQFKPEEEVRARHILLETEDQAKAVIADLKSGAKFEDLAKSKSKDPSAKQNAGDLGYFTKGEMVPEFANAAFDMKVGDVSSTPVKSQFGWHVIKVEDRRMSSPPPLEQVKPMLRQQLGFQAAEKEVEDAKAKAKIKRFNQDGTPLADEPAKN